MALAETQATILTYIIALAGANPSAEGEDADEGGEEGGSEPVLDIADQFRYQKIEGLSKKAYAGDLKSACNPNRRWTTY